MATLATTSFQSAAPPQAVLAAVHRVIAEQRYAPGPVSPDGSQVLFRTRKSVLSWELDVQVTVVPTPGGSQVDVALDTAPGRPKALLDGRKNRKSAQRIADEISAAIG
ncbi:hypothetical protein INN71_14930 [Nocardioides sp. ChNu-153]|uniref:hypothetical protein n=1 Tax=Nocardioides sp. ChNu-153 TaxID=2779364 RepID=UPI00264DB2BE|nr:hypothetical protein [Nocardioides sp. ChNu-153]MDN7122682.1 hypothetical protein [Nocardioides sp. ChNu-153]